VSLGVTVITSILARSDYQLIKIQWFAKQIPGGWTWNVSCKPFAISTVFCAKSRKSFRFEITFQLVSFSHFIQCLRQVSLAPFFQARFAAFTHTTNGEVETGHQFFFFLMMSQSISE
jgi:hypothetical protein